MTLEEIRRYSSEYNKKRRSKAENTRSLNVFYSDSFPETIYREKHPHLSDGEINYIKKNYNNPVKKLVGDAIFETQKIFTDNNYAIECSNETINEYIKKYEIMSFFKNIYWQNTLLDSNCVLTYHIKYSEFLEKQAGIERGNEYLPVHPYIVTPENIIYRDKNKIIYNVKGDKKSNFVAFYYNEENILTYEHYSFDLADENTQPLLIWQFETEEQKRYFRNADGIKIVNDNELVIESYLSPSIPLLSSIMFDSINLSVTQMRTTFPIPVVVGEPCSNGCHSGMVTEYEDGQACEVKCKKCNGTGYDQPFSPFNTMYVTRGNNALGGDTPPAPHLYWVDPPQGAVQGLREQIEKNMDKAFDYIGINYSNSHVQGSETALGKMIDREKLYSTFKMYSQDIQITLQWWFEGWIDLMFRLEKDNEIKVNAFNNFKTFSTAEINSIFTELQNANAPLYQLRDMLRERYNAINELEKFEIVDKYYLYEPHAALIQEGSLGYYDKTKIVISKNIMKWVDEVIGMNENDIDKYLNEKAQSIMTAPMSENNAIVDTNSLYEQLKKQTEDAGMEVEEVNGKVVVTGDTKQ